MNLSMRLLLSLPTLGIAALGQAAENHLYLVDFAQPWANRGFRLEVVNKAEGAGPLSLLTARLRLGIGDGKTYREVEAPARFGPGVHDIDLQITKERAQLRVNGEETESKGAFLASSSPTVSFNETYKWLNSRTCYELTVPNFYLFSMTNGMPAGFTPNLSNSASIPLPLRMFEFPLPTKVDLTSTLGEEITFHCQVKIASLPASAYVGAIDKYGQARDADWPGKVRKDEEIKASAKEEAARSRDWKWPADWDDYGGLKTAGWRIKPTGFFQVAKKNGAWWLVTPKGNPVFYTGLCTAPATKWETTPVTGREDIFQELPPKNGLTASLWQHTSPWTGKPMEAYAQHSWNLVRKFGKDWEKEAVKEFARRSAQWGFSGQGKFSDSIPGMSRIQTMGLWKTPKLVRHPDFFDPQAAKALRAELSEQASPLKKDPRIVGFSVGNEYDEIITTDEIRKILIDKGDSPSAKAIRAKVKVSDPATVDEIEAARRFYADAYYAYLYRTVKELAPHHLYFGYWITPGWWQNEADWDLIAEHCDIIGYDLYRDRYAGDDGLTKRLLAAHDKPTLVGEFGFPAWYGGRRGFGRYSTFVEEDKDSGEAYARYVADAAADPRCVGATYFQYRDEPITGRSPGEGYDLVAGERFAFGLVDITDRPKWDFVTRAREANLKATLNRLRTPRPSGG